jgi:hypothetical protein
MGFAKQLPKYWKKEVSPLLSVMEFNHGLTGTQRRRMTKKEKGLSQKSNN